MGSSSLLPRHAALHRQSSKHPLIFPCGGGTITVPFSFSVGKQYQREGAAGGGKVHLYPM